jgi:hypothetical protein
MNKLLIVFSLLMLAIYVNGTCIVGTLACTECTTDKCTACKEGFFVSTGDLCAKCGSNCNVCKDASECKTCVDGFYLDTKVCKSCVANCAICTSAENCQKAKDGYWLEEGGDEGTTAKLTASTDCLISYTILGDPNT